MYEKIMKGRGSLAAACALALASTARAQSDAAAGVAATDTLEEVVVSARMRDEDLRDVPISIVAIDAEALAQRGATELKNLGDVVPNVIIGTGNSERRTNLVIRGISTEARSIGQETGVGVYLDGVLYRPGRDVQPALARHRAGRVSARSARNDLRQEHHCRSHQPRDPQAER